MVFKTKRDLPVSLIMTFLVLLIQADAFVPFILGNSGGWSWTIFGMMTFLNVIILWSFIDLKYVLDEHHLYIKAGLIRSKIPYHSIDKVIQKNKLFSGYRLIGSRKAITIYYRGGFGHLVISPMEQKQFIEKLIEKNPDIIVEYHKK